MYWHINVFSWLRGCLVLLVGIKNGKKTITYFACFNDLGILLCNECDVATPFFMAPFLILSDNRFNKGGVVCL